MKCNLIMIGGALCSAPFVPTAIAIEADSIENLQADRGWDHQLMVSYRSVELLPLIVVLCLQALCTSDCKVYVRS